MAEEAALRGGGEAPRQQPGRRGPSPVRRLWYVLLLLQFPAVLVPAFYARQTPELWGFPFFYWYQLLWVFIAAGLTGIVYILTRTRYEPRAVAEQGPVKARL